MRKRFLIKVAGIVQGVGFRPYIFRLANRWQLGGFVHNHPDGVLIEIEGNGNGLQNFVKALKYQPPPLALISGIDIREIPNKNQSQFRIPLYHRTLIYVRSVDQNYWIRMTGGIYTRLSIVPIVARVIPLFPIFPMTVLKLQCPDLKCAHSVRRNMTTH